MAPRWRQNMFKGTSPDKYKGAKRPRSDKPIPNADSVAMPILRNWDAECALVDHCIARLAYADDERQRRADRCEQIDVQMSGYIRLSDDDIRRQRDNTAGKAPKPVKHNIPLTQAQIDEAVTYLMSIYAPDMDIFEAVSSGTNQQLANALTQEVNRHGQRGQYFRHLTRFCSNALRYNFGPLTCYWEQYQGIMYKAAAGQVTKEEGTVWAGNVLESADVYNFLYDTAVHPVDIPIEGEFFAQVYMKTPFWVRRAYEAKKLFAIERYIDNEPYQRSTNQRTAEMGLFYREPPSVRDPFSGPRQGNRTNWQAIVSAQEAKEAVPGIELIRYTTWLKPSKFGLSKSDKNELWRLVIANGQYLTFAAQMQDTHGMLPCVVAAPIEDDLRNEQRTYAEMLLPLQHFASFLLNAHQDATRKALAGITFYNANVFPMLDKTPDELYGAKIAYRSSNTDFDIRKSITQFTDVPPTDRNVEMIARVNDLMQKILPTDTLKQVTDLERATLYQAAATVQAGDRRNLKIARMISDQGLQPLKFMMIYNIYANTGSIEYIDPQTGESTEITPDKLVAAKVEFDIATGLKGIDRLMHIQIMRDIITSVIQNKEAMQEFDVPLLLAYFAALSGEHTDLSQFRRKTPLVAPPDGSAAAAPSVPAGALP